jgi:GntR family transcriptional regulator
MIFDKILNKENPTPLYYQLKEILLEYIPNHRQDSPIPTELELSHHFGISRPTVRQAISELVTEGYLYRIKGKGTFVARPKIHQEFLRVLDSFNNEIAKKDLKPSTKVLGMKVIECDKDISKALNIAVGSKVIKLKRLRFVNDEPIVIVTTYLPFNKCNLILEKDFEKESLYTVLEKDCGYILSKAVRELEAILAGEYEASLLKIEEGAPIQFIKSVTYLSDNTPIEYSFAKYRGDRNKFTFEMKR